MLKIMNFFSYFFSTSDIYYLHHAYPGMASWEPRDGLYVFVCACVLGNGPFFLKTKNKYWKLKVERCLLRHSFVLVVEVIVTTANNRWPYAGGMEKRLAG